MKIEITMAKEKRMVKEFDVTEEELGRIKRGDLPDRIDDEFDGEDWSAVDAYTDWAVWDCDNGRQIVDWE